MFFAHFSRLGLMLLSLSATILTAPAVACEIGQTGSPASLAVLVEDASDVCLVMSSIKDDEEDYSEVAVADPDADYVAFTVTRDGSFGVGVDESAARASSLATAQCRKATNGAGNCGSQVTVTRGSWILVHRCGDQPLIITGTYLEDTEQPMINAEIDQQLNFGNAASCKHRVTVDPAGLVTRLNGTPATSGAALTAR